MSLSFVQSMQGVRLVTKLLLTHGMSMVLLTTHVSSINDKRAGIVVAKKANFKINANPLQVVVLFAALC